jgi:cyclic beta-1,2-glucan synthetase
VTEPCGEAIYVRDEISGDLWKRHGTADPDGGTYVNATASATAASRTRRTASPSTSCNSCPLEDPLKISRLTLRNRSERPRRLSVTAYAEWVLGTSRGASAPFVVSEIDADTGAMLARNPWSTAFPAASPSPISAAGRTGWTADRTEFLGRHGGPEAPAALAWKDPLSGTVGAGLDPCAALATTIELAPGETAEIVWLMGQCASLDAARALVVRYRDADLDGVLRT